MILYTTGCPKCKVLEEKLNSKGIIFTKSNKLDEISEYFSTVPVLKVDNDFYDFSKANAFINNISSQNKECSDGN